MLLNKSATRTIEVLELLARAKMPLTLKEICDHLSLPKSSGFELVNTLLACGALEYDSKERKTFRVGIKMFQIGATVIARTDLYREAHRGIELLSRETDETAYLAVEKEGKIVYLDKVESEMPIRSTQMIGSTHFMHLTGLGKALLATHTDEEVAALVGTDRLEGLTEHSIQSLQQLLEDLHLTRTRGYAFDDREGMQVVRCIAAPVRGFDGNAVAAISVAVLDSRLPDARIPTLSSQVVAAALEISRRLGYTGRGLYEVDERGNCLCRKL